MSCILRVSGDKLDLDALLSRVGLTPMRIWRKGEVRSQSTGALHRDSGAAFEASDAEFEEGRVQISEAAEFLRQHIGDIRRISGFENVDELTLDFGVAPKDPGIPVYMRFPPAFVQLAASVGLGLEVSSYPGSETSGSGA
jgi:hypothetical protein